MPFPSHSHESVPVGIIGAGPIGLLSALLLARMGIRSMLIERRDSPSPHPKAVGISRRSGEIFRQLGLTAELQERSLPLEGRAFAFWGHSLVGEEIETIPRPSLFSPVSPCLPLHCSQEAMMEVLMNAIETESAITFCPGSEVVAVTGRPDGARVSLLNHDEAGEYFFSYLIAADGAESTTRRMLDVAFDGPTDSGLFLNSFFRADYGKYLEKRASAFYYAVRLEGIECFIPINGTDLWLLHHRLKHGETLADYPSERLAEIIRSASGLPEEPVEVVSAHQRISSPKIASRFQHGRIFLVGDAAARLSPAAGLGMNVGLQSAYNLAWKIAAVLNGEAAETLLESYQTERRAASLATFNLANQRYMERIDECAAQGDWAGVREGIKRSRLGGAGLGIDFGSGYETGAFIAEETPFLIPPDPINDYLSTARPGSRAPHLWVQRDGKQISTLDLLGQRITLLAGRQGGAWHAAGELVNVLVNGEAFNDGGGDFEGIYGISKFGAVLVRPDGIVAARFPDRSSDPFGAIQDALKVAFGEEIFVPAT